MPNYSIPTLVDHGADLLRDYLASDKKRTESLRSLAVIVVGIRAKTKHNGKPDWSGRSPEYRANIAAMYEKAGVPPDSQSNVQAALRYHVGNVLRDKVKGTDLERSGLKVQGPREQARTRSTARAVKASAGNMYEAVSQAATMLQHASGLPLPEDDETKARTAVLLIQIEHQAETLRAKVMPTPVEATVSPIKGTVRNPKPARRKASAAA